MYRYAFNKLNNSESINYSKIQLKNIELLDSWFIQSAITDAKALLAKTGINSKVIFGGKKNFIKRCKGLIDYEEFNSHRNIPLCSFGEQKSGTKSVHGNRKFKLNQDLNQISLKLKNQKVVLNLQSVANNLQYTLKQIYKHQLLDDTPLTYKVDNQYLYISFDESVVLKSKKQYS